LPSLTKLKKDLDSAEEIQLSVVGRKSGRKIPRPVWFVRDGDKLLLLPGSGRKSQWYKNASKYPNVEISANGDTYQLSVRLTSRPDEVKLVVDKFREKYGAGDVKRYYENFDAAAEITLA